MQYASFATCRITISLPPESDIYPENWDPIAHRTYASSAICRIIISLQQQPGLRLTGPDWGVARRLIQQHSSGYFWSAEYLEVRATTWGAEHLEVWIHHVWGAEHLQIWIHHVWGAEHLEVWIHHLWDAEGLELWVVFFYTRGPVQGSIPGH